MMKITGSEMKLHWILQELKLKMFCDSHGKIEELISDP